MKNTIKNDALRERMENYLNSKILNITMTIMDHYPELAKYLEEMPMTVQPENNSAITLDHLKTYYGSLTSLLYRYRAGDPKNGK